MSSAFLTAQSPRHDLGDEPGFRLQRLPHIGVEAPFGDVAVDRHLLVRVALPEDAALPLLDLGGLPRGVEVMQGHQPLLDVGAGAHLGRRADQDAHRALADLLEQGLLLGVGVGVAHDGDLVAGDAVIDQLLGDLVVGGEAPRRRVARPCRRRSSACRASARSSSRSERRCRPGR